jgi:hypothetical protein
MGMADQIVSTASVNTIGLNDYQWGRMMENGIAMTFMESLVPIAVDIPLGMAVDVSDSLSGKQGVLYPFTELPIIKQPIQFGKNMTENAANFATAATLGQVDASQFDRGLLGVQDPENIILKKMGLVKDRS